MWPGNAKAGGGVKEKKEKNVKLEHGFGFSPHEPMFAFRKMVLAVSL